MLQAAALLEFKAALTYSDPLSSWQANATMSSWCAAGAAGPCTAQPCSGPRLSLRPEKAGEERVCSKPAKCQSMYAPRPVPAEP